MFWVKVTTAVGCIICGKDGERTVTQIGNYQVPFCTECYFNFCKDCSTPAGRAAIVQGVKWLDEVRRLTSENMKTRDDVKMWQNLFNELKKRTIALGYTGIITDSGECWDVPEEYNQEMEKVKLSKQAFLAKP